MNGAFDGDDVIQHEKECRDLLKRLLDRELFVAVAIAGVKKDGAIGTTYYHQGANIFTLFGGVEHLKQRINDEQIESTTQSLGDDV